MGLSALPKRAAQPLDRAQSGPQSSGEAGAEQIAACERFPIDHFPCDKNSWQNFDHEILVERAEAYTTCGADSFCQ